MAVNVNPVNPALNKLRPGSDEYFRELNKIIFQLYNQGQDTSSTVTTLEVTQQIINADSEGFEGLPVAVETQLINSHDDGVINDYTVSVTGVYYAGIGQSINATHAAVIYFPEYPADSDGFTVRNGDGSLITLNGNGKKMNGSTTGKLKRKGTSIDFVYHLNLDEWFSQ